jgi:hypothetical protein
MWLVTTQGFYSVVAHRGDPDRVLVRARVREDLEALRCWEREAVYHKVWAALARLQRP